MIQRLGGYSHDLTCTPITMMNNDENTNYEQRKNMEEVYRTSDQGLAAYLLLLNYICLGAIPTSDPQRMDFVFINVDNPAVIYEQYMENKAEGKLLAFRRNLMKLRKMLRENVLTEAAIEEMRKA